MPNDYTQATENDDMLVGKEHAADRLMQSRKLRRGSPYLMGAEPPSPAQVAAVLHALADHTLIENMLHRAPELGADRANLGEQWALTSGVGRYLQRMGNWCEGLNYPPAWPCDNYAGPDTCLTVGCTTPCDQCLGRSGNRTSPATTDGGTAE